MSLSIDKINQIRELAKQGYDKSKIARRIGCNRKTVNRYIPKEVEEESEVNKKIFQMLNKGIPPVKIVEEIGYPDYVLKAIKIFKKLSAEDLKKLLNKKDALLKEVQELREEKEQEENKIDVLISKKNLLEKDIASKEEKINSLEKEEIPHEQKVKFLEKQYNDLTVDIETKKDWLVLHDFLSSSIDRLSARSIIAIVLPIFSIFAKWFRTGENKEVFSNNWDPYISPDLLNTHIDEVLKALEVLRKKLFKNIPLSVYMSFVDRVLKKEIDEPTRDLAIKEGYQKTIEALTHYPCSICGKDMIISREQLAEAMKGWVHTNCKEKNKVWLDWINSFPYIKK